jgi:hypothetical protein
MNDINEEEIERRLLYRSFNSAIDFILFAPMRIPSRRWHVKLRKEKYLSPKRGVMTPIPTKCRSLGKCGNKPMQSNCRIVQPGPRIRLQSLDFLKRIGPDGGKSNQGVILKSVFINIVRTDHGTEGML